MCYSQHGAGIPGEAVGCLPATGEGERRTAQQTGAGHGRVGQSETRCTGTGQDRGPCSHLIAVFLQFSTQCVSVVTVHHSVCQCCYCLLFLQYDSVVTVHYSSMKLLL